MCVLKTVLFIYIFYPNPQNTTNGQTNKTKVLYTGSTQTVGYTYFFKKSNTLILATDRSF